MYPLELLEIIIGYSSLITRTLTKAMEEENKIMRIDDYEYLLQKKERDEEEIIRKKVRVEAQLRKVVKELKISKTVEETKNEMKLKEKVKTLYLGMGRF